MVAVAENPWGHPQAQPVDKRRPFSNSDTRQTGQKMFWVPALKRLTSFT